MKATTKLADNGRLVVPVEIRRAMGLQSGASVILELVDGNLHMRTMPQVVRELQALSRELLKGSSNVSVDDFLAEKHRETAEQEAKEAARGYP